MPRGPVSDPCSGGYERATVGSMTGGLPLG